MQNKSISRAQQIGQLQIPKVLFFPKQSMLKEEALHKSTQLSPIKGSMAAADVQGKLKQRESEHEQRMQDLENSSVEKARRSSLNRQAIMLNRISNIDQQFERWRRIRNNIEFMNKAKMQYIFDYYENMLNKTYTSTPKVRSEARQNKSYSVFDGPRLPEKKKSIDPEKQKQRLKAIFNQQYKCQIEQIDYNLKVHRKQLRTRGKCMALRKPFYNVEDLRITPISLIF